MNKEGLLSEVTAVLADALKAFLENIFFAGFLQGGGKAGALLLNSGFPGLLALGPTGLAQFGPIPQSGLLGQFHLFHLPSFFLNLFLDGSGRFIRSSQRDSNIPGPL